MTVISSLIDHFEMSHLRYVLFVSYLIMYNKHSVDTTSVTFVTETTSESIGWTSPGTITTGTKPTGKFDFFSNRKHLFCSLKSSTDNIHSNNN